jgi:hypothetical protein
MIDHPIRQRHLIAARHLKDLFVAQRLASGTTPLAADLRPTPAEIERAVASIRAWRAYLPGPCVAKMIYDGWHWST